MAPKIVERVKYKKYTKKKKKLNTKKNAINGDSGLRDGHKAEINCKILRLIRIIVRIL